MRPSASASGAVRSRSRGVQEDLDDRAIAKPQCVADAQPIGRAEVADLFEQHDQVWHW
ncbi:MAG: hypothetical protein HYU41_15045 [Candidatus Rokubacteria bacterium]|nr:hypothetical protein [Candidatus Rokubacteria bacterium]